MWLIAHDSSALLIFHDHICNLNVVLMWREGRDTHTHLFHTWPIIFYAFTLPIMQSTYARELCYFSMRFRLFVYFVISSQWEGHPFPQMFITFQTEKDFSHNLHCRPNTCKMHEPCQHSNGFKNFLYTELVYHHAMAHHNLAESHSF